ncbi:hypothetical protein NDU88_007255 [Pleurodeles waltl]|uniref:Uncharacterized protein n=1 Tax=Pleurodeles waltl TaxID=8319 RepID=A0AAV7N1J9_PLEWA|nr:hypothetical protein NDU88_007255 [Pleurodeles waltl]
MQRYRITRTFTEMSQRAERPVETRYSSVRDLPAAVFLHRQSGNAAARDKSTGMTRKSAGSQSRVLSSLERTRHTYNYGSRLSEDLLRIRYSSVPDLPATVFLHRQSGNAAARDKSTGMTRKSAGSQSRDLSSLESEDGLVKAVALH